MLRLLHGDRTIHERRQYDDRPTPSRLLQLPQFRRTVTVRPPQGRREPAVRFSRQPKQGEKQMSPHGHRKATLVTLR